MTIDWKSARLGGYDEQRKCRTVYVPCEQGEDPRKAAPKPKAKPKRKVPRTVEGEK